jgi:YfiR/HmsC-like
MNTREGIRGLMPPGASLLFRRLVVTAVAVCAVAVFAGLSSAQAAKLTDLQRKALILFNFAKFTEWPKSAFADDNAPFVIGVLGKDPFGKDIDIIKTNTIKGRRIEVKIFPTAEELTECHLLFISSSEMQNLPRILKRLGTSSILTTAEAQGFIEHEGIINLVSERQPNGTETVGFEVNLLAAGKASLKLDTQLLRLAKKVKS